jgi:hypothetical protein
VKRRQNYCRFCRDLPRGHWVECIECTEKNSLSSYEEREVSSSKTTYRVTEHSVGSARCALRKGAPRGREAFLFKKYFGSEIEEILQQHKECAQVDLF